jgi:hypothetical protein
MGRLLADSMTRVEALEMEGIGWDGDLDEMRRDHLIAARA